jgi:DNA-binding transcriptional regulator YhcF (GntR family)
MPEKLTDHIKMPAYVRVAESILEKITSGFYKQNALLPSERILAAEYQTSPIVINKALNILAEQKVIEKIPRKGNVVKGQLRVNICTKSKISILGFSSPRDLNERQESFRQILREQFPDISIEYVQQNPFKNHVPSFNDTDIIILQERNLLKFLSENWLEPLDGLIGKTSISDYFPQPFRQCKVNGATLGIPLNLNASVLFCNMKIIDRIAPNTDFSNLSWHSFIEICGKIKKYVPELTPLGYFDFPSCWWENFLYTHGLDVIRTDRFETDIFTERGMTAIGQMRKLVKEDLSDDLTVRRNALEMLKNDRIAFFICIPRFIKDLGHDSKWHFAPVPFASVQTSAANSFFISVSKTSANVELSKEIASFMLSEKFQFWMGSGMGVTPVNRMALSRNIAGHPGLGHLYEANEKSRMLPNMFEYWEMRNEMGAAIHKLLHTDIEPHLIEQELNMKLYAERRKWNSAELVDFS